MTAMHLHFTPGGKVNDRLIRFYETRAQGGVGLAVVGGCTIGELSGSKDFISLQKDDDIEGLSRLTDAVHAAGGLLAAQLYHAGAYVQSAALGGQQALSPSGMYCRFTRETPRAMSRKDIEAVIDQFAGAAIRAKKAGFDAVEILASAGYLICQFLSPLTNTRADEYGGELPNRMRFGVNVLKAVRNAVGPDFPVICRIAGNDFVAGSHTNHEARQFAEALEKAGVDAIDVTGGWHETRVPQLLTSIPPATFAYLAQGVKESVSIPVIACNRIKDPRIAEDVLRTKNVDFVGMARAFLADPFILKKAKESRFDEIVHCIGCAQACFDHVFMMQPVSCLMNPRCGREFEIEETETPRPKRIWVCGGGPAGMSVAATAAKRGHEVTLFEKSDRLGGQLRLAGIPKFRRDFLQAADDLESQVRAAGVRVRFGESFDPKLAEKDRPDAVVIAAGAVPVVPDIPGADLSHVVGAWDLLTGKARVGMDVVIIGGGAVGCETAVHLCEQSVLSPEVLRFLAFNKAEQWTELERLMTRSPRKVKIVEMLKKIGADIGLSTRWSVLQDLRRYGVRVSTDTKVVEIFENSVIVSRGGKEERMPCDSVVLAVGSRPVRGLKEDLAGIVPEIHTIGDAKGPRKALDAVWEGYELGLTL